jgi:curved DNA-binding protein CbpA
VLPKVPPRNTSAGRSTDHTRRELPPEVKKALDTLGLGHEATWQQIRTEYRTLVKGYHPDMVAHLGPELRRVAEAKSKELNHAYAVLERFQGDLHK